MSKCPECKKEITKLNNFVSGEKIFSFDGDNYDERDFIEDSKTNDYECPECKEVLFKDEEEVVEFFKGKTKIWDVDIDYPSEIIEVEAETKEEAEEKALQMLGEQTIICEKVCRAEAVEREIKE